MIRFLKRIGIFFLLLVVICISVFSIQTWNIRSHSNFELHGDYNYLMLGHSHAEAAYNDTLIANFKNLATSGESYFYTFYKLKMLLEQNENLKTILIEFTNNQINQNMDKWIWGDKYISKFYPKYGSFLDFKATGILLKNNVSSLINNFSVLQERNLRMTVSNNYNFINQIGGYVHYIGNNLEKAKIQQEERVNNIIYNGNEPISEINIQYLTKIIALCKDKEKEVIFIRSPQYKKLNPPISEFRFLKIYAEQFAEVKFIDFNNFQIPDSGFKDYEHLNYLGANIISKTLDSLIKVGSLSAENTVENGRIIISH